MSHELDDEERRLLGGLFRSHPRFGRSALSIKQCLLHRAVPVVAKQSYVDFMHSRYPSSDFQFPSFTGERV